MEIFKKNRAKVVVGTIILIALFLVFVFKKLSSDQIIERLPKTSKVVSVYRTGGFGNGDYRYALKVKLSREDFLEFVGSEGLSDRVLDPTSVIGYEPSTKDVPGTEIWIWDEPRNPELKFYNKNQRSFVRATFNKGMMSRVSGCN
jgi:hypothetical protein